MIVFGKVLICFRNWGKSKSVKLDPSVYVYHHNGEISGFLVIHVDDILVGGKADFHQNVVKALCSDF